MKTIIILTFFLLAGKAALTQSAAVTVSYNKSDQPALKLELPYDESVSEDFIVYNLKKTGYDAETKGKFFWKQSKMNGYYIFKEVKFQGIKQPVDLYFKVDGVGRKSKDESVIYLLVSTGNDNFVSSGYDENLYSSAQKFLDGFVEKSAAYKLELDVKAQEEVIKDEEKKYSKLDDTEKELNKKLKQLEEDLKDNKKDKEQEEKKLDSEKKKLDDLKKKI
ncbi:MAG: hypothetical protein ACJ749_17860 [Flavisolibacter sp.]